MIMNLPNYHYFINRILQVRVSICTCTILCLIAVIQFFATPGTYYYSHLPVELIDTQLYKRVVPSQTLQKSKPDCKYDEILKSKQSVNPKDIPKKFDHFGFDAEGVDKGSYVPSHCNPLFSVAILVTYRNRLDQLNVFLPYMHDFLRKQNIHYKIYLIEQQHEMPWNKGLLYNIGAKQAIRDQFPCLILHDVDLLPLDASNLYACTNDPRHMSASIDKLRYVLTYDYLVEGVLAIRADNYVTVNGFSNKFEGWRGEEDDFANRLSAHKLGLIRFPRYMSRYTMMLHPPASKSSNRFSSIAKNTMHSGDEGLSTMPYQNIRLKHYRLFTLIKVKLPSKQLV